MGSVWIATFRSIASDRVVSTIKEHNGGCILYARSIHIVNNCFHRD